MKRRRVPQGFTIVEVMIFLAVAGALLAAALLALQGKQGATEFNTGLGDITSSLESAIGNVSNGYYQLPGNVGCTVSGKGTPSARPTLSNSPTNVLGTQAGCVYIGEVIQFGTVSGSNQTFTVHPVVGLQFLDGDSSKSSSVSSLADAKPDSGGVLGEKDLSSSQELEYGITVPYMSPTLLNGGMTYEVNGAPTPISAVGFFTIGGHVGNGVGNPALTNSGVSNVEVVPIPTSQLGDSELAVASDILNLTDDSSLCSPPGQPDVVCVVGGSNVAAPINPNGGISICFNSGSSNESAKLTIGGTTSPTTINVQRYGTTKNCS